MNTEFLISYKPQSKLYTSQEEICKVSEALNIYTKSKNELQELRDKVVEFYSDLLNEDYSYMSSMQSVTTIIDHQLYTYSYKVGKL